MSSISEEVKPTGPGGWATQTTTHEKDLNTSSDFLFLLLLNSTSKAHLCPSSGRPHSLLWLWSSEDDDRRVSCSGCVCEGSSFDLAYALLTDWQMVPFKLICSIWMVSCWHLPEMTTEKICLCEFRRKPDTNKMQVRRPEEKTELELNLILGL